MSATLDELNEFHRFAAEMIQQSETPLELDEILCRWYDLRDRDKILAAIRQGVAEIDQGLGVSVEVQLEELRKKYFLTGFPE